MKRLISFVAMFAAVAAISHADVFVSQQMSATKGNQVKGGLSAGTYYAISGIDQSNREFFLYDNGGQVKGSSSFPSSSESTASHVWTLKASGNEWIIVNVGTGKNMELGSSNASAIKMSSAEQTNAIHFDSNGYMTILNSNGQAIDMTANGANPTTWSGTTTPNGSRRLKIYAIENTEMHEVRSLSLLPAPKSAVVGTGEFPIHEGLDIFVGSFPEDHDQNQVLSDVARFITTLGKAAGISCQAVTGDADMVVRYKEGIAAEGYILDITEDGIVLEASTSDGVYYAMQSLLRLLPPNVILGKPGETGTVYSLPVCRIEDEPRFSYRGFMLDVSRHFFTVEQIKKMLDLMAIYKMNVFHWHLTDDQGWRAEIKQYPLLTSKGAERRSSYDTPITRVEENGQVYWTGEGAQTNRPYGPFYYTQEEMKDVVRYAAERHIDVLPEVDMPGHFVAALHAYPQFSCHPDHAPEVWITGGVSTDVLNVANPKAVQFAKNIITELCEIFPYPYFHIGGDECPTSQWETNAQCQEKLRQLGKSSYRALQTEFIREINEHLATLGKKIFCWNESVTDNGADLDLMKQSGATIMCWNPCQAGAAKAASLGLDAIITEWGSGCYYINRRQSNDYGEPTGAGYGGDDVAGTYNYVPVPSNVSAQAAKHYIGVQATFWAEHVSSNEYLEYAALPRFMCIAEAGWTPQEMKNWPSFVRRMTVDTKMLDLGGYIYARHWMEGYVPRQAPAPVIADGSTVTFTNKSADRGQCLADADGTLNGQGSACTQWTLEAAPGENRYYIRSNVSGKYLYSPNGNSGTQVELSTDKTAWAFDTSTIPGYVAICYESTSGNAVNNNVSNATRTRLFAHGTGNGASFWLVDTPYDPNLKEGETGRLTYKFRFRGLFVGTKEFNLQAGSEYPAFEEHVPEGYVIVSGTLPSGNIHLKQESVEIEVERVPLQGRFYRFHNTVLDKYLCTTNESSQTYRSEEPDAHTIFYYQDNRLLSYERGLYLSGAELSQDATSADGQSMVLLPSRTGAADMLNIIFNQENYLRIYSADNTFNTLGDKSQASKAKAYDFRDRMVLSLPVALDANGWAAFSSPVPVIIPQGCMAYVADRYAPQSGVLSLASLAPGTAISANTGILLRAEPSSVVEFVISENGCTYTSNLFRPSIAVTQIEEGRKAYVPSFSNGTISFRLLDATQRTVPAHAAWLQIDETDAPATIYVNIPGEETSVDKVPSSHTFNSAIFNIQGQKLNSLQQGINIVDGRKVIVK